MLQIAIVEDSPAEREKIRECLDYVTETEKISFHIQEFSTGASFLFNANDGWDIVFMDIDMPEMNGMETARAMRKTNQAVILIFVTNMAQYAISGYEVDALDFILKPINKYSFAIKVKRAVARTIKRNDEFIPVRMEGDIHQVRIASIKYLDMQDHHVIYHTVEGDYSEYITLKEACEKINRKFFVYCNRSYLVNMRHITSVGKDTVKVGGDELIISRPQRKAFLEALSDFMRGRV